MRFRYFLAVLFLAVPALFAYAAEKETVAVIEFQNRSNSAVLFNGTDMAAWMSNDLKRNDRFQQSDRKAVAKIVKNAKWMNDRLSEEDEAKLLQLPTRYALYGSIVDWRSSIDAHSTSRGITPDKAKKLSASGVVVVMNFELVDLATGKVVKSMPAEGTGVPPVREFVEEKGSLTKDLDDFDRMFEEASRTAIRKGAALLSKEEESK